MPKHEKRNAYYRIVWKVNMKFESKHEINEIWPLDVMLQRKIVSRNSTKDILWKLVLGRIVFTKN